MKKIILLAMALCFAVGSHAQSLDLGIKLGANFAQLRDVKHADSKTGFVGGAFLAVGFEKFAIQPEILYSQQGSKFDIDDFDLDYINVPIMFKFYLIGHSLNVQAGPQFGFVVHDDLPSFGDINEQVKAKNFDFSGAVGLGLDLAFGIRLDARYHFGLTDVSNNLNGKNSVISLAVGYSFL